MSEEARFWWTDTVIAGDNESDIGEHGGTNNASGVGQESNVHLRTAA